MYDETALSASFGVRLVEIDEEIRDAVRCAGCPWCEGPLDTSDYPRKPRGIPEALEAAFSTRFSLCCRWCRRRVTPPSVRFLGRRVYAGVIVLLATMGALLCGASRRTLGRWRAWWTTGLLATSWWLAACARLIPAVDRHGLPGELLRRFERADQVGQQALLATLRFLQPVTARLGEHFEGGQWTGGFAQKTHLSRNGHDLVGGNRVPARLN